MYLFMYFASQDFKVSSFEQRLLDEIDFREGRVAPQHHVTDSDAFRQVQEMAPPALEQVLKNFQLMEGSDATFVCKVNGNPMPNVSS